MTFYNDCDTYCCRVLRKQIEAGRLYEGYIDGRKIQTIRDQGIYRIGQRCRQIHLFAGIGGFPLGFRWAGIPDDASVLTGGPPCQPFSHAGRRAGTADARYLWPQMLRFIRIILPRYVVFENVAGFASWGNGDVIDTVVTNLAGQGYEVLPPLMVPAAGFGAWHRRDRIWIIAHASQQRLSPSECEYGRRTRTREERQTVAQRRWWDVEPAVGRVADGVPSRVDRLKGLGNAIVPQHALWIGKAILEHQKAIAECQH